MDSVIAAVNFQFGMQIPARGSQDVKKQLAKNRRHNIFLKFFFFQISSLTFVVIGFHYHVVYSVSDENFFEPIMHGKKT